MKNRAAGRRRRRWGQRALALLLALGLGASLAVPVPALELDDARRLLREYYVDTIPEQILSLGSLEEILSALGDPYTSYLDREAYSGFLTGVNGQSLVGIGVSLPTTYEEGYEILSVLPNSPAQRAGLVGGDVILQVDGQPLTPQQSPVALIQGEIGTPVVLRIRHRGGAEEDYTLIRDTVTVPIITYEQWDRAGYITCDSFGLSIVPELERMVTGAEDHVNTYIVDLRQNPGGLVDAAVDSAGVFSGYGVMTYFRDSRGEYTEVSTSPDREDLTDKPLLILTDPYSASGSELFAAAIRDYGTGVALGQRTFGKGVAQILLDAEDYPEEFSQGDAMKITQFRYYSPKGATNDTVGVLPYLLLSAENTQQAALLLSGQPIEGSGQARLLLSGQTFYVDLEEAVQAENRAAFTELLEALPPSASLSLWEAGEWRERNPEELALSLGLAYKARSFTDVEASPYQLALDTLGVYRILSGYEDGSFRPEEAVTRAEFCSMIALAFHLPSGQGRQVFSDVDPQAWYAGVVSAMAARGFLAGFEDGTFRPEERLTGEQAVAVLENLAAWACMEGYRLRGETPEADALSAYSAWSRRAAWALSQLGVEEHQGLEEPAAPLTRGSAAQLLYEMMSASHLLWGVETVKP